MTNKELKKNRDEIIQYAGTKRGDEAKLKYDVMKLEEERRTNKFLFVNTILLTIIALINLIFTFFYLK